MRRGVVAGFSLCVLAGCQTAPLVSPEVPYQGFAEAIRAIGFEDLALPTTAYGPGSLVTSRAGSGGLGPPLKLAYICRPDFASAPPPLVDEAASGRAASALAGGLAFNGARLGALGIGANASYVESVTLTLANLKVEQLPYEDAAGIIARLGPGCAAQVHKYKSMGIAYQTLQALRGDVTYQVTFKAGASAEVKTAVINGLGLSAGGSAARTGDASVSATGLYLGLGLKKI